MIRVVALALACAPVPADATVFEYLRGKVLVNGGVAPSTQRPAPGASRPARPQRVAASRAVYRDMAEQVALRHAGGAGPRRAGLDAVTFARVFVELVRAESAFDPRALSPKGAQGLGQLMPATARMLGVADPWDPEQNLDGAVRYFSEQLERFGDVRLALAAYNAGPHRIVEYGGVPPFRETRNYVAKITAAVALPPPATPASSAPAGTQPVISTRNTNKEPSVWQY